MKLRWLAGPVLVVVVAWGAAACGGPDIARPEDPVLAEGQRVYDASCASCHGKGGGGGATGPKLSGVVEARYTLEEHIAVITEGRGGSAMPAFRDLLTPEEIEAVARYEREVL
jgi:mono/diheme cytochrome c family protein